MTLFIIGKLVMDTREIGIHPLVKESTCNALFSRAHRLVSTQRFIAKMCSERICDSIG